MLSVLYLLLGDVSLNKLLQNPTVVDVSVTTGTQRPISLSARKHRSSCSKLKCMHAIIIQRTTRELKFHFLFLHTFHHKNQQHIYFGAQMLQSASFTILWMNLRFRWHWPRSGYVSVLGSRLYQLSSVQWRSWSEMMQLVIRLRNSEDQNSRSENKNLCYL